MNFAAFSMGVLVNLGQAHAVDVDFEISSTIISATLADILAVFEKNPAEAGWKRG